MEKKQIWFHGLIHSKEYNFNNTKNSRLPVRAEKEFLENGELNKCPTKK